MDQRRLSDLHFGDVECIYWTNHLSFTQTDMQLSVAIPLRAAITLTIEFVQLGLEYNMFTPFY